MPEDIVEMNTDDRKSMRKPARGKRTMKSGAKKSMKNLKHKGGSKKSVKSGSRRGHRK
jgi:hypothetical protein